MPSQKRRKDNCIIFERMVERPGQQEPKYMYVTYENIRGLNSKAAEEAEKCSLSLIIPCCFFSASFSLLTVMFCVTRENYTFSSVLFIEAVMSEVSNHPKSSHNAPLNILSTCACIVGFFEKWKPKIFSVLDSSILFPSASWTAVS